MTDPSGELADRECRIARRLERLFRIERNGGFTRFPVETVARLVERRAALVETLAALDATRRAGRPMRIAALDSALEELAAEVARSLPHAEARVERLRRELGRRGGSGSGLRTDRASRLLGRG